MSGIQVISKQSHDTIANSAQNSASIQMTTPSVVLVQEKLENVAEIKKDGSDLIVIMKDGQAIVLENYFAQGLMQHNLVFEDGPKELVWTQFTDPQNFVDGVVYENIDSINGLLDFSIAPPEATPFLYGLGIASLVGGGIALMQSDSEPKPFNVTTDVTATRNSAAETVQLVEQPTSSNSLAASAVELITAQTSEQTQGQTQQQTAATDASDATAQSAADQNTPSDAIYNLLSNAEQQPSASPEASQTNSSLDLDWSALFSSSGGDIQLPESAAQSTTSTEAASSHAVPEATTFDNFALQNLSLFDLLSTTWVG